MKGWDRMGYDASLEIRTVTNEVMGKKKEAQLKKAMAVRENWAAASLVCHCSSCLSPLIIAAEWPAVSCARSRSMSCRTWCSRTLGRTFSRMSSS